LLLTGLTGFWARSFLARTIELRIEPRARLFDPPPPNWKEIVDEIGGGTAVYLTAALIGKMKLRPEQADRAARLFDLDDDEKRLPRSRI